MTRSRKNSRPRKKTRSSRRSSASSFSRRRKDKGNAVVKSIIEEMGLTSTTGMKMSTYNKVVERLVEICTAHKAELEAEEGTKNDGAAEE